MTRQDAVQFQGHPNISDSKYFYVLFIMLGGGGLTGGGQNLKIKLSASTLCSAYIIT